MNNVVSLSIALTTSALTIGTVPVYAANSHLDFSQMFVFGDSLSDTGNFLGIIEEQLPDLPFSPLSFKGRASNGPVWIESLASSLDLDPDLINPTAFLNSDVFVDGANYAIIGAQSGNQNNITGLPGLKQQLESFIAPLLDTNQSANSDALYTIWVGSNDYLATPLSEIGLIPTPPEPNPDTTVNNIINGIEALYDVGARNFLIPNLTPSLELTALAPLLGTSTSDIFNELANEHNQKLELAIAELEQSLSEATITLFNFDPILPQFADNPSQFGLTNVTDSWSDTVLAVCPDAFLGADGSVKSCDENIPDPDEYLFWDIVHPTEAGHQVIANEALYALKSEYNQTVPEPTSILSLLGLGIGFLGISAFKQNDKQKQKQKV
ncbi:SGNH/GDSL hydrolase family protein [Dapis sp. BLCC M229]|uniref:SGNH/GDSL hydrolase family protein n=1 Tax=Dapis sp. BLCC M229 TaxID=3400188 RepID=UPI003CE67273